MKVRLFYLFIVLMLFSCNKEYVIHDPIVVFPNTNYVAQYNGNLNITMLEGRGISVNEVEKLQGVPIDYTKIVSSSKRYEILGNGWTVYVIAHIFESFLNGA